MDCYGCGKCCYKVIKYLDVELFKKDLENIPINLREFRNNAWWMKRKSSNACIALNEKTKLCTIYSKRPKECRDFNQNHPVCNKILELAK
jgi:Fe-S-cluster containining protein